MIPLPVDNRVVTLAAHMRTMPQAGPEAIQTDHYFADGMYARRLSRKAGTLIVGKVHKREHLYIVTKGAVQVNGTAVYYAGDVIVSQPGTQRAVLALEDSVCMTVHRTDKKNIAKIERELIEYDADALYDSRNNLKLLGKVG